MRYVADVWRQRVQVPLVLLLAKALHCSCFFSGPRRCTQCSACCWLIRLTGGCLTRATRLEKKIYMCRSTWARWPASQLCPYGTVTGPSQKDQEECEGEEQAVFCGRTFRLERAEEIANEHVRNDDPCATIVSMSRIDQDQNHHLFITHYLCHIIWPI